MSEVEGAAAKAATWPEAPARKAQDGSGEVRSLDIDEYERADSATTRGVLEAREVSCWFGSTKVLERVSLVMRPREVTALIGPSGCGKSTFLRTLNRMHELVPIAPLSRARCSWTARTSTAKGYASRTRRLRIGMVFQKPNPFPSMTIAQNVLAGLRLAGLKVDNKDALVQECLTRAGLWKEARFRLNQSGAALSGGQQQRLCIARALAVRPEVLLMDEPCSALDPISTGVIEQTIAELSQEITIVIVTHNMQQAQRVSHLCALSCRRGRPARPYRRAGPHRAGVRCSTRPSYG